MPANASQNETPLSTWALDREIVLSRVINAPRELVFSASTSIRATSLNGLVRPTFKLSKVTEWIFASTANGGSI